MNNKMAIGIKTLIEASQELDNQNNLESSYLIDAIIKDVLASVEPSKKIITSGIFDTIGQGMEYAGAAGQGGVGSGLLSGAGALLQGKGFGGALKSGIGAGAFGGVMAKVEKGIELILQAIQPLTSSNPKLQGLTDKIKSLAPIISTAIIGGKALQGFIGGKNQSPAQNTKAINQPSAMPQLEDKSSMGGMDLLGGAQKLLGGQMGGFQGLTASSVAKMIKKSSNNKYSSKDILYFNIGSQPYLIPGSMYSMLKRF